MKNVNKLRILIDSYSIDKTLPTSSQRSIALFKYHSSDLLEFLRTPETVENKNLQEIVTFEKKYKSNRSLHLIEITRANATSQFGFSYRTEQIEEIGKIIYGKEELDADKRKSIELVFIQATLNHFDEFGILVTANKILLENRLWFESHFPGRILNIMTVEEVVEIVDLFLKYNGVYPISDYLNTGKGGWHWLSFRTKVPFFHVVERTSPFERSILDEFAQKFVFLLMGVDEMGFQYYSGVNNDTMDGITYHFNYFISLMTGIFDSLAIYTKNQYRLVFKDSNNPSRTSLHSDLGKHFLQALKKENPDLRKHIHDYVDFINVIYLLRPLILHREGLQQSGFENKVGWKANFLQIPQELVHHLRQCGDKKEEYEPWTQFGVYGNVFLEPFKFAKSGTLVLSSFCNKYLQLLGFTDFIQEIERNKPNDDFTRTIREFQEDSLGL